LQNLEHLDSRGLVELAGDRCTLAMHGVPQQSTNGVAVQPVVAASGCLGGIAPPTYAGSVPIISG
jgi:hypothetical protein